LNVERSLFPSKSSPTTTNIQFVLELHIVRVFDLKTKSASMESFICTRLVAILLKWPKSSAV